LIVVCWDLCLLGLVRRAGWAGLPCKDAVLAGKCPAPAAPRRATCLCPAAAALGWALHPCGRTPPSVCLTAACVALPPPSAVAGG
jgi:hypothetical protein